MTYEISTEDGQSVRVRAVDPDSPTGYVRERLDPEPKDWQHTCGEELAATFVRLRLAPGSSVERLTIVEASR